MSAEANVTVTDHAALRWLQRVQGLDVPRLEDMGRIGESRLLIKICADHGTTPEAVKARIWSPHVRQAHRIGASKAYQDGHWFIFKRDVIVTVMAPECAAR